MQIVKGTYTSTGGQVVQWQGQWTRFGDIFVFSVGGHRYQGTFQGSNQIFIQGTDGSTVTWTRGVRRRSPPSRGGSSGISGIWSSSTGSAVQITAQGNQVFVSIVGKSGRRYDGSGYWISPGRVFQYTLPGNNSLFRCTIRNRNQIVVDNGDGRPSVWCRQ